MTFCEFAALVVLGGGALIIIGLWVHLAVRVWRVIRSEH